jgi:hypothetical protein
MAESTNSSTFPLNYPVSTDPVNVHGDIKSLAEEVTTALDSIDTSIIQVLVKNISGSALAAGTPVIATGYSTSTEVVKATIENPLPILGLLKSALANNQVGQCVVTGVLKGIDTNTMDANNGDVLYVSETGFLTGIRPNNGSGAVGILTKKDSINGVIIVEAKGNGTWGALKNGLA